MTLEVPAEPAVQPWTGGSWEELTHDAYEVFGADLEKGNALIGVPMCIVRATFRYGDYKNVKTGEYGWYVSLDVIIGPEAEIKRGVRRGRIPEENQDSLPDPDEHLVFNEGGTGVYRQIVKFLEDHGYIQITSELPQEGHYGECRYDVLPQEWALRDDLKSTALRVTEDGIRVVQFDLRILCPRGLRASDYENEFTKDGRTRYIA